MTRAPHYEAHSISSLIRTDRTSDRGGGGRYAYLLRWQRHANRTVVLPTSLLVLAIRADADEHLGGRGAESALNPWRHDPSSIRRFTISPGSATWAGLL